MNFPFKTYSKYCQKLESEAFPSTKIKDILFEQEIENYFSMSEAIKIIP